ncbi:MAG: fused MFS/spermidine synthase [Myxococcales bacterium]|nr:fused MFS/spermidine synthase [Myxococcales bacterium]
MRFRLTRVAPLLFFSGACALVYQVAWLRELRLVFGASTAASAAVLGVFMGGLGLGGIVIGKRADRTKNPLELYANLELLVALSAALTPLLVWLARTTYLALGGQSTLGIVGATVARLALGALVLIVPTTLMGGTMPAAARAVSSEEDPGRRAVSALYGVNTLGAVVGALAANFVMLEVFGTRLTLWMICLLNVLVGLVGRMLSRAPVEVAPVAAPKIAAETPESAKAEALEGPAETPEGTETPEEAAAKTADAGAADEAKPPEAAEVPPTAVDSAGESSEVLPRSLGWFPSAAAAIVGFAFLLMELVWYRMLAPLLGGSSYTFGLILAVALFGIGVGGALYSFGKAVPTLRGFALTCGLEALFIALPFAAGDRVALFALAIRPLRILGFGGSVLSWAIVCSLVIFPAAVVSGAQFPLVIGLFGKGGKDIGRQIGVAYLANTLGAIVGSLSGGFGLLPALTAPGCWKLVIALLAASGLVALFLSARHEGRNKGLVYAGGLASVSLAFAALFAEGPTAAWRHTPIGAGRADSLLANPTPNAIESWRRESRLSVVWDADGRESSVALNGASGYTFVVNGKADGNVFADAPTQVMSGLLGALVHPNPKRAMVIGLGTGSTSGWLGSIPSMERIDVSELEPAILRVARDCGPINNNVFDNPKVHLSLGDAREFLLTTRERYDVVFSEPSNPYRAGISSLYTQDYYRAVLTRLADDGVFVQWMQSYEVEAEAFHTVLATLRSVFGDVTVWESMPGDFLMVARRSDPGPLDTVAIGKRLQEEPYLTASRYVWGGSSVEVFLSHFIARDELAKQLLQQSRINRDDQNILEFSYARSVGASVSLAMDASRLSQNLGWHRPRVVGPVDWARVDDSWLLYRLSRGEPAPPWRVPNPTPRDAALHRLYRAVQTAPSAEVLRDWSAAGIAQPTYLERLLVARAAAKSATLEPAAFEEYVKDLEPATASGLRALSAAKRKDTPRAIEELVRGLHGVRSSPWVNLVVLERMLQLAVELANERPEVADKLYEAVKTRFPLSPMERQRSIASLRLAMLMKNDACAEVFDAMGGPAPWDDEYLLAQRDCFKRTRPAKADAAEAEYARFQSLTPTPLGGR